ncbi:phosphotransferase enzyme family protein [Sphingobacterium bovistauri]|uniref:Aminoglycoside phosphotransferase family protein n=1 Tax=Sphingobacterium bovistauri TaxID=2781959 RepID=A0ABS7Z0D3_9SPHI|nr:aminoglycoside phosphotransferase family protein [Sphingobacterium bovistauri]MCA5003586.1 aminoglycoside phosphotransferase family protein [Sphingobacterium bovistauri]
MNLTNDTYLELKNIVAQFNISGEILSIEKFGSGHINDTFRVSLYDSETLYLLQKINHHIFPDIDGLMQNIHLVTSHLKSILKGKVEDVDKHTLSIILCIDGKRYYKDVLGQYWRVFILLDNVKSYDIVETYQQAYSGGCAFGEFQKQLSTLDANQIIEVLPNFHNIDFRLDNLSKAIEANKANRLSEVSDLLAYIDSRKDRMRTVLLMAKNGDLPLRITHNDTKFNNVLLDQHDNVQCVIDLDTVMPGYVAYDFGDAIRTIINSSAEDEKDLSKIVLNVPLYQAYTEGYLKEACDFLTEKEIESLFYGVLLLPFMQAVRFLTDYIDGDLYYKIHYLDHNLVRTRAQIKLVQELEANEDLLKGILYKSLSHVN